MLLAFHAKHALLRVVEGEPVMGAVQMNGQFPFAGEVLAVQVDSAAKVTRGADAEDAGGKGANLEGEGLLVALTVQLQPAAHAFLE